MDSTTGSKTISKAAKAALLQGNTCPAEAGSEDLRRKGPTKLWVPPHTRSSVEPRVFPAAALLDIIPDYQAPNPRSVLELAGGEGTPSLTAAPNLELSPFPTCPPVPASHPSVYPPLCSPCSLHRGLLDHLPGQVTWKTLDPHAGKQTGHEHLWMCQEGA